MYSIVETAKANILNISGRHPERLLDCMRELCRIFIEAGKKKKYKSVTEFQYFIKSIKKSDRKIRLDWDYNAGEEWARFLKNGFNLTCCAR